MYMIDFRNISEETYLFFAKRYGIETTMPKKLPRAIWEYEYAHSGIFESASGHPMSNVQDGLYYGFDESKYEQIPEEVLLTPTNDDLTDEKELDALLLKHVRKLPHNIYTFSRIAKKKEVLYQHERDKKVANGRYFDDGKGVVVKKYVLRRK